MPVRDGEDHHQPEKRRHGAPPDVKSFVDQVQDLDSSSWPARDDEDELAEDAESGGETNRAGQHEFVRCLADTVDRGRQRRHLRPGAVVAEMAGSVDLDSDEGDTDSDEGDDD